MLLCVVVMTDCEIVIFGLVFYYESQCCLLLKLFPYEMSIVFTKLQSHTENSGYKAYVLIFFTETCY